MKRMPFERPTSYYDERINKIDEQLCELIKQRKEISNNNPGFPPFEYISNWAKKFELYEDFLKSLFGALWNEEHFRPIVEPKGFRRHLPVLKSVEIDNRLFSIISIQQYINSSLVTLYIDWDDTDESDNKHSLHSYFEMSLGKQYDCRMIRGSGAEGHFSYSFIVSPPLPDNISGIELTFKEYNRPFTDKPAELEISMKL